MRSAGMAQAPLNCQGLTLVELVVVAALVAVLLGLAVPAWERHVMRAYRMEATSRMLRMAACQEIHRADTGQYDSGYCRPTEQEHYRFAYQPLPADSNGFSLSAEPTGRQTKDRCGTLTLDHRGQRGVLARNIEPGPCWAGR